MLFVFVNPFDYLIGTDEHGCSFVWMSGKQRVT